MHLDFHPVTEDRWNDFQELFEGQGGPHYCWCMAWRVNENKQAAASKAGKKASMKRRVRGGVPIGLLAYCSREPIAWCSIAPRDTYKPLGGDPIKENVWSLACFFVKRPFRNQGLTSRLLRAAIEYARQNGGKYVEAYPVDPQSPSYRFMGLRSTFEKAGFRFVKKAGTRRNVMLLDLS